MNRYGYRKPNTWGRIIPPGEHRRPAGRMNNHYRYAWPPRPPINHVAIDMHRAVDPQTFRAPPQLG
jgi:hypothetical protein